MSVTIEDVLPCTPTNKLLLDALADAEREILKLRRLLVTKLCDCRKTSLLLHLEPHEHSLKCLYRRSLS